MVQKNLIIFLALLWIMPPLIAKRSIMPKFQKMSKISNREEVNRVNSPHSCTLPGCTFYATPRDGVIDIKRQKRDTGIQYRHEKKEDTAGFIPKLIARPEYRTVYQHQGMLLQNLHRRYLLLVIRLPHLKDLDQKIPSFPNCDNYRICRASNPNPLNDDTKTNDNELHQQLCVTFRIDYLQEMDIITKIKARLECKINVTLLAPLPNKIVQDFRGLVTSSDKIGHEEHSTRSKRAIPLLAIVQGTAAIGGMLIKGVNALVDAKRANSFNNAIKMLNANVEITHNRLVTLENRTSMMAKAIIFKRMVIDWTNTEVTSISSIRIDMPSEAKISMFTDYDLTHITDDHFEIKLVARLLDQIYIVPSLQSPLGYDDTPSDPMSFTQTVNNTGSLMASAPMLPLYMLIFNGSYRPSNFWLLYEIWLISVDFDEMMKFNGENCCLLWNNDER